MIANPAENYFHTVTVTFTFGPRSAGGGGQHGLIKRIIMMMILVHSPRFTVRSEREREIIFELGFHAEIHELCERLGEVSSRLENSSCVMLMMEGGGEENSEWRISRGACSQRR